VKVPDGSGGWQDLLLPNCAATIINGAFYPDALYQWYLLSWLNAIWGSVVCRGHGVRDFVAVASGNSTFGTV